MADNIRIDRYGQVKTKILMLSGSFPAMHCGIGDYTARLASALAQDAIETDVVILTKATPLLEVNAAAPASVQALPIRWTVRSIPTVLKIIRQVAPDLVHLQYPGLGYLRVPAIALLPLLIRFFCRIPVVVTIHEFRDRRWPWRIITVIIAFTANAVLVPDALEAAYLQHWIPPGGPHVNNVGMISTIPLIIDTDKLHWQKSLGIAPCEYVVATFGLIHPRRRLETIVEAIRQLHQEGVKVRLLIIGGEADYDPQASQAYAEAVRQQIRAYGLDSIVLWVGFADVPNVSALLQLCNVCVLLYPDGASQRNTTLQAALEHGTPVITTAGRATSEWLCSQSGITFLPAYEFSSATLAAALRTIVPRQPHNPSSSALHDHLSYHRAIYDRLLK